MTARLLSLPAILVYLAVNSGCSVSDGPMGEGSLPTAPEPRAKLQRAMTAAELLIGKWKRTAPEIPGVLIKEFTSDGKLVERSTDQNGGRQTGTTTYRLVDNELVFPDAPYTSDDSRLIAERTTLIEKLTEQELITVTVIRTRLTPEAAAELAELRREPIGRILAEVRETRHRAVYVRLKNE